tara:strand:+ start:1561 stop:2352 length:792 start_codon:yes stop_codon:yes gene_type:complete
MSIEIKINTLAELHARGESPEVVFWVGCAGSFDEAAQSVTKAFVKILSHTQTSFAVLGDEESCTGDPAKRAGNEFLFQAQALQNIERLNHYGVTKIITTCPHCFNTLKNEYSALDGHYEVYHHSQFLKHLLETEKLKISETTFKGKRITYHDPCYLGRANQVFEAPRHLLKSLQLALTEMKSCKSKGLCCGAGGAQMFKESEEGKTEINLMRTKEALDTAPNYIATGCPFCKTMMRDGIKNNHKEEEVKVLDIAELIVQAKNL